MNVLLERQIDRQTILHLDAHDHAVVYTPQALDQVVALAASTIGLPSAVAVDGWVHDVVDGDEPKGE